MVYNKMAMLINDNNGVEDIKVRRRIIILKPSCDKIMSLA
jgi:hypothetical protein